MAWTSSIASRIIGSRSKLLGSFDALENVITTPLNDGAICYVNEATGHLILRKAATAAPNGVTIIRPIAGPGRWFREPYGMMQGQGVPFIPRSTLAFTGPGVAVTDDLPNDRTVVTVLGSSGGGTLQAPLTPGSSILGAITPGSSVTLAQVVIDESFDPGTLVRFGVTAAPTKYLDVPGDSARQYRSDAVSTEALAEFLLLTIDASSHGRGTLFYQVSPP